MVLATSLKLPSTPLFGTDGIRGKVGEVLNGPLALEIGFWAGRVLQKSAENKGPVILGQDPRNSSNMLAEAITSGLTASGVEVWHIGLCPTPCVAFLTSTTDAIGGVMISASHNPPEDNGIKIFGSNGTKLAKSLTQEIEAGIRDVNSNLTAKSKARNYLRPNLTQDYLQGLLRSLPSNINFQGLRIVLDLAWGAAVELAPAAFKALGAQVICINDEPNGSRINVNCGSTNISLLQEAVKTHHADLGFAFDGDADRVIAVDSQGRVVDGDYILYFWGKYLQQHNSLPKNIIVATVMANLGFEQAWRQLGGEVIRTAVGDQHVQAQMWDSGAMLGGEQSGHILCHHYSVSGDGLQTALHLTALGCQWGTSLTELVETSFATYPQILKNVRVKNREILSQWQECEAIQQAIAKAKNSMGEEGRVLVRASGTEPLIRVMVEASQANLADYWTEHIVSVVDQSLAQK